MPILLKKIDASIISYFNGDDANHLGGVKLIRTVIGEIGLEEYILLSGFEGLIQDFSSVIDAEFCTINPISYGVNSCSSQTDLNISF
tara:strand:- start:2135 stop:2395 length:261 start_codon:yes stop_codon:yes gene_type:complete